MSSATTVAEEETTAHCVKFGMSGDCHEGRLAEMTADKAARDAELDDINEMLKMERTYLCEEEQKSIMKLENK